MIQINIENANFSSRIWIIKHSYAKLATCTHQKSLYKSWYSNEIGRRPSPKVHNVEFYHRIPQFNTRKKCNSLGFNIVTFK